jgi:outer membrane protein assembly factor BamD
VLLPLFILLVTGCSSKDKSNQSDEFWYKEIVKQIDYSNMDKADENYVSLQTEHLRSPLLPTATMLMIQAHLKKENYLLAGYYIDVYEKMFGTRDNRSYLQYLRIKSKYFAFQQPKRDQKLLHDTLQLTEDYLYDFPDAPYVPYVKTVRTNLTLSKFYLTKDIIKLYDRLDKPKAMEYYEKREDMSWFKEAEKDGNIEEPSVVWIRMLFE